MMKPETGLLKRNGLKPAGEGIWTRIPQAELNGRIADADVFISDFDECMFPSITQATASFAVLRKIFSDLSVDGHPELALNMTVNAAGLLGQYFMMKVTKDLQNSRLILQFEKFAKGIPISYFDEASDALAPTCYAGVTDAFRVFASRGVPVGVISLGLDIVIRRLLDRFESDDCLKFSFYDCTHVRIDSSGRFAGYMPGKTYTSNEDKRHRIRARCDEYGAKRPLVVGHDRDDTMMFDETKRIGGTCVGFNPVPDNYGLLDVAVFAEDWRPMAAMFGRAISQP